MGRYRGRGGRFEEEKVGSLARLTELLDQKDVMEAEEKEAAEVEAAKRRARSPSLKPLLVPMRRKVGVTLSLTLAAVEALDRLSISEGRRRGDCLEDIIMAAVKAKFGGQEVEGE